MCLSRKPENLFFLKKNIYFIKKKMTKNNFGKITKNKQRISLYIPIRKNNNVIRSSEVKTEAGCV